MPTGDQTKPEGGYSLGLQSWLFPPHPVSLNDLGPNQPLHLHNQNTSNFGFPAPHLLPRSASAGVPVFSLPPLPALPRTLHRYASVSTLRSVTRHSSADLQLCKSADRSTRVGPLHAHNQNISPTNSCSLSTSLSTLYRSVRYRNSSLERSPSRASSHVQVRCHPNSAKAVHTTTPSAEFTPRSLSRLPSRSVSDTHLWFAVGESLDHPGRKFSSMCPLFPTQSKQLSSLTSTILVPFLPRSRVVSLDKATEAREQLYRCQGPPIFIDRTRSSGTRSEQTPQPPASRNLSLSSQRDSQQALPRNYCVSYPPSPSARAVSFGTLQSFPEESTQSDISCALVQCPPRPSLSRAISPVTREGFGDILSQTRTGISLGPIPTRVPTLRRSISARSHRELFFSRKQFFHQTNASSSNCIPTKATHRRALTRSLSVGNYKEIGGLISTWQEPLFVDIEKRPNFDFVFPDNITQSTSLLYQSRADRSRSLVSQKSPAYVPLLIVAHRGATPNLRKMSATETAKHYNSELSAESSDAVNGGSTEEAATPPTIEPTTPIRDTRVFFVSSKRHTISPPHFLNQSAGPVERTSRSPSSVTKPHASFFKRLKNKIFRRRSQQRNMPESPQSKARPVVSRARQVIRRASSMNLFIARQRSQAQAVSSAALAHPPTRHSPRRRRLSPLRSETPVDVGSLLEFGGRIEQRSSHASHLKADVGAEGSGPSIKFSTEQLNRRRNRMTVVAGDQTYVDGRPGQPFEWKWTGEDEEESDGGDGWQADGYDTPHSLTGTYPEASVQTTAQTFTQLTCPAPSEIRSEVSV
jgi:hypothetical protein